MSIETILRLRALIFWGGLLLFLVFELWRPYRSISVPKSSRFVTNVSLAVFNSIVLSLLFASFVVETAMHVTEQKSGILNILDLPFWVRIFATVVFMDFMLYIWHLLNHEVPLFWRFHRVHHSDLNMDVSTASRFHIGELSISAVIKIALVYFLGTSVAGLVVFESLLVLSSQFQHSSLRVPKLFEKIYWLVFVPPSMHRIHHSVVIKERDTNYGTIFSIWDRMLGTLLSVLTRYHSHRYGPYQNPDELKLYKLIKMPFTIAVK
jgi:sterol desaturase/sphingolipid hydroxylase (fatty acid hydroxylase superfamily)